MIRPAVPDPAEVAAQLWEGFGGGYGWDVGANCGQSVSAMLQLFTRFTCFEPCAGSYEFVLKFLPGVDVRQLAVSDHDGELELAYPADEQRETGQLVTIGTPGMEWTPADWSTAERITVPCRTADSLAVELGPPDFMKVDTEGHEAFVMRGAPQIMGAGLTDFLIEFHSPGNYRYCLHRLKTCGYRIEVVRHPHYPEDSAMWHQHGWIRAFAPGRHPIS